ncbi:FecR domain-containing protein [Alistipes sp. OttesenSCG-928-B03]|nr:FecR domain-containing protein [Alistipes sp. OttesenSCG-928-B03]
MNNKKPQISSQHEQGDSSRISLLIARYVAGVISDDCKRELDAWRAADERHEEIWQAATDPKQVGEQTILYGGVDTEAALSAVTQRYKASRKRRPAIRRIVAVAAAVAVIPLALFALWQLNTPGDAEEYLVSLPGVKAELFVSEPGLRAMEGEINESVFIQQGVNVTIEDGVIVYKSPAEGQVQDVVLNTVRIPRGGSATLMLADGTRVMLNSGSTLRFPIDFTGDDRRVSLDGEAFFEVTHNPEKPFIVNTHKSYVQVLGTSFNVCSYESDNRTVTTLTEGSVMFVAGDKSVTLLPGQQAILGKEGSVAKKAVDTWLYTAWKEGVIAFNQERLEDLMIRLSRLYDVDVEWGSQACRDELYSGKISRYDDVEQVLEILEATGSVSFVHGSDNKVYVK